MVKGEKRDNTKHRRAPRVLFPAIGLAAHRFHVSRITLWRALTDGTSRGHQQLRRRYYHFLAEQNRKVFAK
jgi:hypothetical protein